MSEPNSPAPVIDPTQVDPAAKIGLWGPPNPAQAPTVETRWRRVRRRRPWGIGDVGYGFLALLLGQVVLLPVLLVWAVGNLGAEALDSPAAVDLLMDEVTAILGTGPGMTLAVLLQWAAFVGIPVYASYRKGHRSLAKDFGLWFKKTDPLAAFGLVAVLQVFLALANQGLAAAGFDLDASDNTGMVTSHHGVWLVVFILVAAVGAPITEELFFRGLMLRAFLRRFAKTDFAPPIPGLTDHTDPSTITDRRRRIGIVVSVAISTILFGIMHTPVSDGTSPVPTSAMVILASQTGFLGLVFAVIAVRTRRIGLVVVTHLVFNSSSLALALLVTR